MKKRTDIFGINPIVSICLSVYQMIPVLRVKINSVYYMIPVFWQKLSFLSIIAKIDIR